MKGSAPITIGHARLCLGTSFMALAALFDDATPFVDSDNRDVQI
jgi:hypothetical protein